MNDLHPPITFLGDVARKRDFHRSKAEKISFRSVKVSFSDDITEKSYVTKKIVPKSRARRKWDQALKWRSTRVLTAYPAG